MLKRIARLFLSTSFWMGLFRSCGGAIFLIALLAFGWFMLRPEKPEIDSARRKEASLVIAEVMKQLREKRGDIKKVAVLHFTNDPTDHMTLSLRKRLFDAGTFDVESSFLSERLRNWLQLRNEGCSSVSEAEKYAKRNGLHAVIIGDIDKFETVDDGVELEGWVKMVSANGEIVADIPLKVVPENIMGIQANKRNIGNSKSSGEVFIPGYLRFLFFLMEVMLLPLLSFGFLRKVVAKRSNKYNALALAIYMAAAALMAFLMVGGAFGSMTAVVIFIVACVAALLYNLSMMSFALKLES